jgi:hypothetical protein
MAAPVKRINRYHFKQLVLLLRGTLISGLLFSVTFAEPIVVKSVRGAAQIQKANSQSNRWRALQKGTPIKPGDTVRTGNNARLELKLDDGSRVVMGSRSRVTVAESAPSRIFSLAVGRVKAFIKKLQPQSKFEIRTPLAAAAVRGTVFEMGYDEKESSGFLEVSRGVVALTQGDQGLDVRAGERMGFAKDIPLGNTPSRSSRGSGTSSRAEERQSLRREVGLGMTKEMVMAAAADEIRRAEYQEGKTITDVNGNRVRLEEYIIRRPTDEIARGKEDQAFKLVVLNERANRFDYFYYLGIFNQELDDDLSIALNDVRGKLNLKPTYYLESYEMGQSNTIDNIRDVSEGGHLVKVVYDGTTYTLSSEDDPSLTRTVAADEVLQSDTGVYHKVYDPVGDRFTTITDAQFQAGGGQAAVYDGRNDTFRPLGAGDTYWRTAYNEYSHKLWGPGYDIVKQSYQPGSGVSTVLARHLDAVPGPTDATFFAVSETPAGDNLLHNRLTIFYSDEKETVETVNTYILSDEGTLASQDAFAGLTTGTGFKNELLKWNYQQIIEASEFEGRKIDLVVEPKILIKSGLIP